MGRIACAFVPRYELALRARAEPTLLTRVAALGDLAGHGGILEVTAEAQRRGVRPGQRLSQARALCPDLLLVPPDPALRQTAERTLLSALGTCSPLLDLDHRGAFFLGLAGLSLLVKDEARFAAEVRATFERLGLGAGVAIADSPFVAWVAAKRCAEGARTVTIPKGAGPRFLAGIPLPELALSERALELTHLLGLRFAGELLGLPQGSLTRRLGPEGASLERLLRGEGFIASPSAANVPLPNEEVSLELDGPTEGVEPLLFLIKSLLDRLLASLANGRFALLELTLEARLDDRSILRQALIPAEPTLSAQTLMDLARLWLDTKPFRSPVVELRLIASRTGTASTRQLALFSQREEKERSALERAVARLTAAFGRDAVVRPTLVDTHRPEDRIRWVPALEESPRSSASRAPKPPSEGGTSSAPPLTLRILQPPEPVRWGSKGMLLRPHHSPVAVHKVDGPHRLSGEWWEAPFDRTYAWLAGRNGELFWVFRDERDGGLYLHAVGD